MCFRTLVASIFIPTLLLPSIAVADTGSSVFVDVVWIAAQVFLGIALVLVGWLGISATVKEIQKRQRLSRKAQNSQAGGGLEWFKFWSLLGKKYVRSFVAYFAFLIILVFLYPEAFDTFYKNLSLFVLVPFAGATITYVLREHSEKSFMNYFMSVLIMVSVVMSVYKTFWPEDAQAGGTAVAKTVPMEFCIGEDLAGGDEMAPYGNVGVTNFDDLPEIGKGDLRILCFAAKVVKNAAGTVSRVDFDYRKEPRASVPIYGMLTFRMESLDPFVGKGSFRMYRDRKVKSVAGLSLIAASKSNLLYVGVAEILYTGSQFEGSYSTHRGTVDKSLRNRHRAFIVRRAG